MEGVMKIIGQRECSSCHGTGVPPREVVEATGKDVCDDCGGSGKLPVYEKEPDEE
jgi:DnaJ-class molecular chaperone